MYALLSGSIIRPAVISVTLCFLALPNFAQSLPKVKFSTSEGDFLVELYPDKAPKTVENFLQYVKDKHYDGTIFHRVINNFMVQGGGFTATLDERKTRPAVAHEGREGFALGLRNVAGTLAMARTNDPQSARAQFFINIKDNFSLDPTPIPPGDPVARLEYQGKVYYNTPRANLINAPQLFGYTVFGKVFAGMGVVNKIASKPTGSGGMFATDVPTTPILIISATVFDENSIVANNQQRQSDAVDQLQLRQQWMQEQTQAQQQAEQRRIALCKSSMLGRSTKTGSIFESLASATQCESDSNAHLIQLPPTYVCRRDIRGNVQCDPQ